MAASRTKTKELLQSAGLAATKQRIALMAELQSARKPVSADMLTERLDGVLNMTTVYRALDQLVSARLVRRIDLGKNHALFELAAHHHHHIVCTTCGRVEDISECMPPTLTSRVLAKATKFAAVEDHALEFFGLCKKCV
jgi:Fe2+ or Zn2+ uptake regulation protein